MFLFKLPEALRFVAASVSPLCIRSYYWSRSCLVVLATVLFLVSMATSQSLISYFINTFSVHSSFLTDSAVFCFFRLQSLHRLKPRVSDDAAAAGRQWAMKSCWYCTFPLKTKTCLSLNMTSESPPHPHPPQSLPLRKKGSKRDKVRERQVVGPSFPCPPLLFELFFHSSSSFCASLHSASDKALHSLPHSSTPPSSLHLPHTPRPHPLPPSSFV